MKSVQIRRDHRDRMTKAMNAIVSTANQAEAIINAGLEHISQYAQAKPDKHDAAAPAFGRAAAPQGPYATDDEQNRSAHPQINWIVMRYSAMLSFSIRQKFLKNAKRNRQTCPLSRSGDLKPEDLPVCR